MLSSWKHHPWDISRKSIGPLHTLANSHLRGLERFHLLRATHGHLQRGTVHPSKISQTLLPVSPPSVFLPLLVVLPRQNANGVLSNPKNPLRERWTTPRVMKRLGEDQSVRSIVDVNHTAVIAQGKSHEIGVRCIPLRSFSFGSEMCNHGSSTKSPSTCHMLKVSSILM